MHVNAFSAAGCFQNSTADLHADFRGLQGKFFIGAFSFYLKCAGVLDIRHELCFNGFEDGGHILFCFDSAADGGDAEGVFRREICACNVCVFVKRLDINGALERIDLEGTEGGCAALEHIAQELFEICAVCALERDLTVFAKNDFFHRLLNVLSFG